MAARRALLAPAEATNEGSRRLRELLKKQSFGALARRLRCVGGTVRFWAREERKPNLVMRDRIEIVLGIPAAAWDEPPSADDYCELPPTGRRAPPPSTKPRPS